MKKFTFGGEKANLVGHLITEGQDMTFDLKDKDGKQVNVKPGKGITIISAIPLLNTNTCDEQSMWMAKMANIYKDVSFMTLTTDPTSVISEWCNARNYSNLNIYSDYKRDFGKQIKCLLKKKDILARGFVIFKDGKIVNVSFKPEVKEEIDYSVAQAYL